MNGGVYLGCGQDDIQNPIALIQKKQQQFKHVLDPGSYDCQNRLPNVGPVQQQDTLTAAAIHAENDSNRGFAATQTAVPCMPAAPKSLSSSLNQESRKRGVDLADSDAAPVNMGVNSNSPGSFNTVRSWEYVMQGDARKCVQKYCELADISEQHLKR